MQPTNRFQLVHLLAQQKRAEMAERFIAKPEPRVEPVAPTSIRDAVREYVKRPSANALMRVRELSSR